MNWLVVLPFELTAAGVTISFWTDPEQTGNPSVNVGVWYAFSTLKCLFFSAVLDVKNLH